MLSSHVFLSVPSAFLLFLFVITPEHDSQRHQQKQRHKNPAVILQKYLYAERIRLTLSFFFHFFRIGNPIAFHTEPVGVDPIRRTGNQRHQILAGADCQPVCFLQNTFIPSANPFLIWADYLNLLFPTFVTAVLLTAATIPSVPSDFSPD